MNTLVGNKPLVEPEIERWVRGVEAIRTYAHPLRLQILKEMEVPVTVKQVAKRLGEPPSKLHYHVNLLHNQEFIQVVAQNSVNGIAEHIYQVTAHNFKLVNPMVASEGFSEDTASAIFMDMLQNTTRGLQKALAAHRPVDGEVPRDPFVTQKSFRLSDNQLTQFHQRLVELIQDVTDLQTQNQDATNPLFDLTLAFFRQAEQPATHALDTRTLDTRTLDTRTVDTRTVDTRTLNIDALNTRALNLDAINTTHRRPMH